MALVKHNNNSISAVTSMASLSTGSMTLISEQTASSSASVSFTTGLDSTYPIYKFEFINIHPSVDGSGDFQFNLSSDSGSNYNVTKTTTNFQTYHDEAGGQTSLAYYTSGDLANGTGFQQLNRNLGADSSNDENLCGHMFLFAPSSTTFVKHFMATTQEVVNDIGGQGGGSLECFVAGYANTTSAVDAIQFKMSTGNIDSGTIKLYGFKDS
jgi:hypothetical protein